MERRSVRRRARTATLAILAALALFAAACAPSGKATGAPSPTDPAGTIPTMTGVTLSAPWANASAGARPPEMPRDCGAVTVQGGKDHSPALSWAGTPPAGTKSYALAMVDTTPPGSGFVHWLVLDIPLSASSIPTAASGTVNMPRPSAELRNETGRYGYAGPAPPAGPHTYLFVLYAMGAERSGLGRSAGIDRFFETVRTALGTKTLAATYTR